MHQPGKFSQVKDTHEKIQHLSPPRSYRETGGAYQNYTWYENQNDASQKKSN
jgi:hypothetical protein